MRAPPARSLATLVATLAVLAPACGESDHPSHQGPASGGSAGSAGVSANGGAVNPPDPGQAGSAAESGGSAAAGAGAAGAAGVNAGGAAGAAVVSSAGGAAGGASCPRASSPNALATVAISGLDEASGLVASLRAPDVFYSHDDSGNAPLVYAFTSSGALVATLELKGALDQDWEDIGIGPGPLAGESYLYVADIGDNDRVRNTSIVVERALEPALAEGDRDQSLSLAYESLYFRYPDGPHNAETLLVDPTTADIYIVTKGDAAGSLVFFAPAPQSTSSITTLSFVTTLAFGSANLPGSPLATGGSAAPDLSAVLIRTYDSAFLFRRDDGASIGDALLGTPCRVPVAQEPQGEAIAFDPSSLGYFTLSEGTSPTLFRVELTP